MRWVRQRRRLVVAAGGAGASALSGAAAGSVVPGFGTLIGAGVGLAAGGLGAYFASKNKPQTPTVAPTDPLLTEEAAQASANNLAALQTQAQGDTASLMARYGTRLALAGTAGGSPLVMANAAAGAARG